MIDLAEVTFMDCSGYRSILASRLIIESEGRAFAITGQTAQPARLLNLIADLDIPPAHQTWTIGSPSGAAGTGEVTCDDPLGEELRPVAGDLGLAAARAGEMVAANVEPAADRQRDHQRVLSPG